MWFFFLWQLKKWHWQTKKIKLCWNCALLTFKLSDVWIPKMRFGCRLWGYLGTVLCSLQFSIPLICFSNIRPPASDNAVCLPLLSHNYIPTSLLFSLHWALLFRLPTEAWARLHSCSPASDSTIHLLQNFCSAVFQSRSSPSLLLTLLLLVSSSALSRKLLLLLMTSTSSMLLMPNGLTQ